MEFIEGKWHWTQAEKQQKREQQQNLVWITNGIESKKIEKNQLLPDGFRFGRAWKNPKKGLTEAEYYGPEKAAELFKNRSEVHSGQIPWNKDIPRTEEEKKHISEAKTGVSIASKGVPKDYPVWNTGRRDAEGRTSYKHLDWAKAVKTKDRFICQHCGLNEKDILQAHHIKGWEEFLEFRFVVENGLTLCCNCHGRLTAMLRKTEGKGYKTIYPKKELEICSTCHRLTEKCKIDGIKSCSCNELSA